MAEQFKILLVTDDRELSDYFNLIVFKSLHINLEPAVNIQHALQEIEQGNVPDLIIVHLPQDEGLQKFFDSREGKAEIPILFTADENHIHLAQEYIPYHPSCGKVSYNLSDMVIGSAIKRMVRIARRKNKTEEAKIPLVKDEIYMELPIILFTKSLTIDYDLFLKMSDDKFIKVFNAGEDLVKEDFEKYRARNVKTVFLKSEDYIKATVHFSEKMGKSLEVKTLRVKEYAALSTYSFDKVHKIINKLGLREEVLILTNQVFSLNAELMEKRSDLKKLLENILGGNSFISEHSLMLTFITTSIAKYMNWPSAITAEKLSLACFFHDIAIDDDELAKVEEITEDHKSNLTEGELLKIRSHGQQAVDLMKKFDGLPPDVEKIILQHHEKIDGSGFPRGLEWKRIFSLSAVFIVAEDFTVSVIECGLNDINVDHILMDLEKKYENKGNFTLAVEALRIAMGFSKPQTLKAA